MKRDGDGGTAKKTTRLKELLGSRELSFLMEAHSGLSAKIAEEARFEALWASGLSISAALGVRDNNEASWTQVLEVTEFMADATSVPILLDGDTGYGNFNSMRRLVQKLEQRGVAGVCIEDKLFPKTNSFVRGSAQPLADVQEFAGKIRAGKEAQRDDDFVIVARVEAFIAGWGLDEALTRAEAYREAGADAILMHSALSTPCEILAFKKAWGDRLPVVIVPTKYYTTPTEVFRDHGFSAVIWANHQMRASLKAMQEVVRQIKRDENLLSVEDRVAPLSEVFRLQGESELQAAEKLYLPKHAASTRAIVLAASRGEELGALTEDKPKCMVEIAGRPLLAHVVAAYRAAGVKELTVVRGFAKEAVTLTSVSYVDNDDHAVSGEVTSLTKAKEALRGPAIVSYGDVLFKKYIAQQLIDCDDDFAIAVDADWRESRNRQRLADYAICSAPSGKRAFATRVLLRELVNDPDAPGITGEWMGFLKTSARGSSILSELLAELDPSRVRRMKMPELIAQVLAAGHEVRVIYTTGHWLDVDSVDDVLHASAF